MLENKNNKPTLILKTDASISRSILTSAFETEIKDNSPASVIAIAHKHDLDPLIICDNNFLNFISLYKHCQKLNKQLIFGIEFKIVENAYDLSPESLLTESKIQVYMRNSAGYKDLIKLYSKAHADKDRFYYSGRLQYSDLKDINEDNLKIVVGQYDNFLHRNLLTYKSNCVPEFGNLNPLFLIEKTHNLPFDDLIIDSILDYTKKNSYGVQESHTAMYYKESDIDSYCCYRAISKRSSFSKPNLSHFSSCKFSVETWLNLNK